MHVRDELLAMLAGRDDVQIRTRDIHKNPFMPRIFASLLPHKQPQIPFQKLLCHRIPKITRPFQRIYYLDARINPTVTSRESSHSEDAAARKLEILCCLQIHQNSCQNRPQLRTIGRTALHIGLHKSASRQTLRREK